MRPDKTRQKVLDYIKEHSGCTTLDVYKNCQFNTRSWATKIVQFLVDHGFVETDKDSGTKLYARDVDTITQEPIFYIKILWDVPNIGTPFNGYNLMGRV